MFETVKFLTKNSPIIIVSIFLYIGVVRPARVVLMTDFYMPLIKKIRVEVIEQKKEHLEIVVKIEEDRIPLQIPFGAFYWPSVVLLGFTKSFSQIKLFTKYHLFITLIIPFCLLIPVLNIIWYFVPVNIFRYLSEFLGLIFVLIGLHNIEKLITKGFNY